MKLRSTRSAMIRRALDQAVLVGTVIGLRVVQCADIVEPAMGGSERPSPRFSGESEGPA